jgi:hypothetical protein
MSYALEGIGVGFIPLFSSGDTGNNGNNGNNGL